jgi:glucose-1-phosphate adenylyltransferase
MATAAPDGCSAGLNPELDRLRLHVTERGITLVTPEVLAQPVPASR